MLKLKQLLQYRPGRLGRNTIVNTFGLGFRAVIQALYLLLLSRWLGAEGYGLFSGIVALFSIATPLASWGSNLLITQYISTEQNVAQKIWATALFQTVVIGSILIIALLSISSFLLPQNIAFATLLLLAISEIILLPMSHAASSQSFALERGNIAAVSVCLVPASRLLFLLLLIVFEYTATPLIAAWSYFFGTFLGVFLAFLIVSYISGPPQWSKKIPFLHATRQGTPYALSNFANTSYLEIDKVIMLQSLGAIIVGSYTIAFRVVTIFALPITALIAVFLPRLISQYQQKEKNRKTLRSMLFVTLSYSILASFIIFMTAPLLPLIFGTDYKEASSYLQLFAIWPIFFSVRQILTSWLTAQNKQKFRVKIELLGFLFILMLNIILIPLLGAKISILILILVDFMISLFIYYHIKSFRHNYLT